MRGTKQRSKLGLIVIAVVGAVAWVLAGGAPRIAGSETVAGERRPASVGDYIFYRAFPSQQGPDFHRFGPVTLTDDAFQSTADFDVLKPLELGVPAILNAPRVPLPPYLEGYAVTPATNTKFPARLDVEVTNECGDLLLAVRKPITILVPTTPGGSETVGFPLPVAGVDHFLCYNAKAQIRRSDGTRVDAVARGTQVDVFDEIDSLVTRRYDLKRVVALCNPVSKAGTPVLRAGPNAGDAFPIAPATVFNPASRLVCYAARLARRNIPQLGCGPMIASDTGTVIRPPQSRPTALLAAPMVNQFGAAPLDIARGRVFGHYPVICLAATSSDVACGDGVRADTEECDDGNTTVSDGCSDTCAVEFGYTCDRGTPDVCATTCGDGQAAGTEECDDAVPAENGDGCSASCTVEPGYSCTGNDPSICTPTCANGVVDTGETCDDGNVTLGDGCDAACETENGYVCDGAPSSCTTVCGDGLRVGSEPCDDGNTSIGDGCNAACTPETGFDCTGAGPGSCTATCGDGIRASVEACDDGDNSAGDGCNAMCTVENGFDCVGTAPSVCTTTCGDGITAGVEDCDDTAPAENGDGCSATCAIEAGYTCVGTAPSTCAAICGDGVRVGAEGCDDGNTTQGDGCNVTCTVETGFNCTGSGPGSCTTICGDGIRAGAEGCDDGNTTQGDGCNFACAVESGYTCVGSAPSTCSTTCGDGLPSGAEGCDDGDIGSGDGCSASCVTEHGFLCTGSPSVCTATCGDGVVASTEQCDDAPPAEDGDGCSATCAIESGFVCNGEPSACVPD